MKHILLAEDQASGRFILTHALKEAGFAVTAAEDGLKALTLIKEAVEKGTMYDLLVTDIHMPHLTGPELFDEIEKLQIKIPSLVMTAFGSKHLVIELMRKGVAEYLDKPFEPSELIERVNVLLEKESEDKRFQTEKRKKEDEEKARLLSQAATDKYSFDQLQKEMEAAKGTYQELLNINLDSLKLKIAYKSKPVSDLGGDFLNAQNSTFSTDVIVADVAGHDLSASFHTILIKTIFDEFVSSGVDLSLFFTKLNKVLNGNGNNERMVTAQVLRYLPEKSSIEIVSAGHPFPIKIEPRFPIARPILAKGDVLGLHDDPIYDVHTIKVSSGTRVIMQTDGLTDLYKVDPNTFAKEKLPANYLDGLVERYYPLELDQMCDAIWNDLMNYCNYKHKDDLSLMIVEIP